MTEELLIQRGVLDGAMTPPHIEESQHDPTQDRNPRQAAPEPRATATGPTIAAALSTGLVAAIAVQMFASIVYPRLPDFVIETSDFTQTFVVLPLLFTSIVSVVLGAATYGRIEGPTAAPKGLCLGVAASTAMVSPALALLTVTNWSDADWLFASVGYVVFTIMRHALWGAALGFGNGRKGALSGAVVFGVIGPLIELGSQAAFRQAGVANASEPVRTLSSIGINATFLTVLALCLTFVVRDRR